MRKARVFIVEDELLVRTGIKMSCDWDALDMVVCGEADDGLMAWEQFLALTPDIVMLDIRIPGIDGMELLCKIREVDLDCRVIIITNIQDFACLHEAMNLDITDYIVKLSMSSATITKALEKAKKELKAAFPGAGEADISDTLEEEFTPRWELALYTHPTAVLKEAMKSMLKELCDNKFREYGKIRPMTAPGQGILYLFDRNPVYDDDFLNRIRQIRQYFHRLFLLDLYVSGGVITKKENHDEEDAYARMHRHYEKGYWYPDMLLFLDGRQLGKCAADICAERLNEQALKSQLPAHEVRPFLAQAANLKKASTPKQWQNELILIADNVIKHFSPNRRIDQVTRDILDAKNAYSALDILFSLYNEKKFRLVASDHLRSEIREALAYIDKNYMHDISLASIAKYVMLNSNYFSNVFVRETGMGFSSYLRRYRIERAKQLILSKTLTCEQLAQQCGLGCSSRFCRTFKQVTGLKPSEYKKQQQKIVYGIGR